MNNQVDNDDIKVEVENEEPSHGKYDYMRNENKMSNLEISNHTDKTDNDIAMRPKFKVPPSLWRTFVCSLVLFVLGCTLIGIGFIDRVAEADQGKGITFWTIGSIVLIPGGYYTYQFWRARRSLSEDEREDIFNEIPEL